MARLRPPADTQWGLTQHTFVLSGRFSSSRKYLLGIPFLQFNQATSLGEEEQRCKQHTSRWPLPGCHHHEDEQVWLCYLYQQADGSPF